MATNMPIKLVLQGTSNKTLNERFNSLPKPSNVSQGTQRRAQQHQATAKNRRLAAQMANRPSVLAALGQAARGGGANRAAVRGARRGGGVGRGFSRGARGFARGRGGAAPISDVKERLGTRPVVRGGRGGRGAVRGVRGQPSGARGARGGGFRGGALRGGGRGAGRGAIRGALKSRGTRGGFVRGRGRGRGALRGRGRGRGVADRNVLDSELDNYMSQAANMDDTLLSS